MQPAIDQIYGRQRLVEFGLDPRLIHANHGAYGAVPESVRAIQRAFQDEIRANPCGFFRSSYPPRIRAATGRVAEFLGGESQDWIFVENATQAANTVIATIDLSPADEVLATDQVYGAVRKAIRHRCDRFGARYVETKISLPVAGPEEVISAVLSAVTDRTRLVFLDHISAHCGIVFPVVELCAELRDRGVQIFVDAAHVPGNIDVDVATLGADYYVGNAHKWLCAPHGSAMLWCRAERQADLHPLTISHGYGLGFTQGFDWPGTHDPSAWLSVPAAIDFHVSAGNADLRARNRKLAFKAARALADEFNSVLAAPESMQCSITAIRLPISGMLPPDRLAGLQKMMETEQKIIVSVTSAGGYSWLRLSAAIYNDFEDLIEAGRRVLRAIEGMP